MLSIVCPKASQLSIFIGLTGRAKVMCCLHDSMSYVIGTLTHIIGTLAVDQPLNCCGVQPEAKP